MPKQSKSAPGIRQLDTSSLIPNPRNAKKHDDVQVAKIAGSIKEFGFGAPIITDGENGILAGHGRWLAAQKLGLPKVPCIEMGHLTETQRRAYMLADNRLAEIGGGWDMDALRIELDELAAEEIDLDALGFGDDFEIDIDGDEPEASDVDAKPQIDKAEELREKWGVEAGQLWQLGDHRILCGDCSDPRTIELLMQGEEIGCTVVDPPYEMKQSVWAKWIQDPCIVFGQAVHLRMIPEKLWRFERVVVKQHKHRSATVQLRHGHAFIAQCGTVKKLPDDKKITLPSVVEQEADTDHDHQKPVSLVVEHLLHWTPVEAVPIVDPFSGSGTTIIACEQLGRKCRAIEISPAYVAVAIQRWADATGKEPRKL